MKKTLLSFSGISLLFALLVFSNGVSQKVLKQTVVDLTEEKIYSLSDGTRQILKQLDNPVKLNLFFSKTESASHYGLQVYGRRVEELLESYVRASNGKLTLEVSDPRPDSLAEERADAAGLKALPLQTGQKIYMGVVGLNSLGEESIIPVFDFRREAFLEYDLTTLIYKLSRNSEYKISVISPLKLEGEQTQPTPFQQAPASESWYFVKVLKELGEVKFISESESLSGNEDLVVVVHPKKPSADILYQIDQHVMAGKNILVMTDPYCQSDTIDQDPSNPYKADKSSNFNVLLSKWGVTQVESVAVADRKLATKVNTSQAGGAANFSLWLTLNSAHISRDEEPTKFLEQILLPWPGALSVKAEEDVEVFELLYSSTDSMQVPDMSYRFGGGHPKSLESQYKSSNQKQLLGVRLRGKFNSNYPEGKPGSSTGAETISSSQNHLDKSTSISNIVVISDVDFLSDTYSVSKRQFFGNHLISLINDNQSMFQNFVENLLGSDELIGIRSRGRFSRPFTKVKEMELKAQKVWKDKEQLYSMKVQELNNNIRELQKGQGASRKQVFSKDLLDKIAGMREERQGMQKKLREVRGNLRRDIEKLGNNLFAINTFAMPIFLILGSLAYVAVRKRKSSAK